MARSKKQSRALAIKLSQERRAGKLVPPPPKGRYSEQTRQRAMHDLEVGREHLREQKKRRTKRSASGRR